MTASERRKKISKLLEQAQGPISASALAEKTGVSRQIVVGDIAILRAAGKEILSTPRGYVVVEQQRGYSGFIACIHSGIEQLREELYIVVDNGGCVEDVRVENPLYGELIGSLMVSNRFEADNFVTKASQEPDSLLGRMTGGPHLHRIVCRDEESFHRIEEELNKAGILYGNNSK